MRIFFFLILLHHTWRITSSIPFVGKENPWLVFVEDSKYESTEPVFLELHATAMLCLPSGECLSPDATLCTTLMSALYTSVSEEVVLSRQLMVSFLKLALCALCSSMQED